MAASDSPSPHPPFEPEATPAEASLGLKQPLLPAKPLGINQQFLVPLGARSLSVLDLSLSSSNSIQADFIDNPFQDSPFFPTPEPATEASSAAESIAPNTAAVNRAAAPSPSFLSPLPSSPQPSLASPPSPGTPQGHLTAEASVQAQRFSAETVDNYFEPIPQQEIAQPFISSETSQSNATEGTQLQRSPELGTVSNQVTAEASVQAQKSSTETSGNNLEPFARQETSAPSINSETSQFNSAAEIQLQRSSASNEAPKSTQSPSLSSSAISSTPIPQSEKSSPNPSPSELSSNIESSNQITESSEAQSDLIQPSFAEQPVVGDEISSNSEVTTTKVATSAEAKKPEAISGQPTLAKIQQTEASIGTIKSQNIEQNIIQPKPDLSSTDTSSAKSIENKTTVPNSAPLDLSKVGASSSENSAHLPQPSKSFEASPTSEAVEIQPKIEGHSSGSAQQLDNEPSVTASSPTQTPDLFQQEREQTTETLLRSPSEQAFEISAPSPAPTVQPSRSHPQSASPPEPTQSKPAASTTNYPQAVSQPGTSQSESGNSPASSNTKDSVESANTLATEPTADGSLVQKQPESTSSIENSIAESSSDFNNDPVEIEPVKDSPIQKQTEPAKVIKDVTAQNAPKGVLGKFLTKANQFISRTVDFLAETNDGNLSPTTPTIDSPPHRPINQLPNQPSQVEQPTIQAQTDFPNSQITPSPISGFFEASVDAAASPDPPSSQQSLIQPQQAVESDQALAETESVLNTSDGQPIVQPQPKLDSTSTPSHLEKSFATASEAQPVVQAQFEPGSIDIQPSDSTIASTSNESDETIAAQPDRAESKQRSVQASKTQPEILTTNTKPSIQRSENQAVEIEAAPTSGTLSKTAEIYTENIPSPVLESETETEIQKDIQPSIGQPGSKPETQTVTVGYPPETSQIYTENTQSAIQESGIEPDVQSKSEVEISSELLESDAGGIQPSVQTKPEVPMESGVGVSSKSEDSPTDIQQSVRRAEAELEVQKQSEDKITPELAEASNPKTEIPTAATQPAIQGSEIGTETQTAGEVEVDSESAEVRTSANQPTIQKPSAEPEPQMASEAGINSEPGELSSEKIQRAVQKEPGELSSEKIQRAVQKVKSEAEIQTAADEVISDPAKAHSTEPEIPATDLQSKIQKSEAAPEIQPEPEIKNNSESVEVSPVSAQSFIQRSETESEIQTEPEMGMIPESVEPNIADAEIKASAMQSPIQTLEPKSEIHSAAAVSPGLVEIPTADIQPAIQRSETEPEYQPESDAGINSELVEVSPTNNQPSVQGSEAESKIQHQLEDSPDFSSVKVQPKDAQSSIQNLEAAPEFGSAAVETTPESAKVRTTESEFQVTDNQPAIQRSEAESQVQKSLEGGIIPEPTEFNAIEPGIQTEPGEGSPASAENQQDVQPSVQAVVSETEIQLLADEKVNSEPIKRDSEDIQLSVQKSSFEPEIQPRLEVGVVPEPAQVRKIEPESQAPDVQAPIQRSEVEPEFRSEPEVRVRTTNIHPSVQRLEADTKIQKQSEVRTESGSVKIQTSNIQTSIQKLEAEPEAQVLPNVEILSESARDHTTEPEIPAQTIQPSVQRLEANVQTELEDGNNSESVDVRATEPEIQTAGIQPSIQKFQAEPEVQSVAEAGIMPEAIAIPRQDIQPSTQAPEAKPELQTSEVGAIAESAEVWTPEPELQVTDIQPAIQRLDAKPEVQTAPEIGTNENTRAESLTASGVEPAAADLTVPADRPPGKPQTNVVLSTQFESEPSNQTWEPGTSQQIQRQPDGENLESADRASSNHTQPNHIQRSQADHPQPDTFDSEIALTQSIAPTPTTDFFGATRNSEVTVQRSANPEPPSENIPQLPQVLQDLSVLQPLSRKPLEQATSTLVQTKGYTSDSASAGFNPVSINSPSSQSFYPEIVQPAKAESNSGLSSGSTVNSSPSVESTDALPSNWSSLAELMTGQTAPIQRSPVQNAPTSQSVIARQRSISGQADSMIQAQLTESSPIRVTHHQPTTTVIAKKEETVAADDEAAEADYLEVIAQTIYDRLKQRMRVEQERHGRDYSGRLPW
jgi:hypothetical protein